MNHSLAALLYVNSQIKSLPLIPLSRELNHKRIAGRSSLLGRASPKEKTRPYPGKSNLFGEHSPRTRAAKTLGLWAGGMTVLLAVILVVFILGIQQVNHTRERIQWARQTQKQESLIQHLGRERQALNGMLIVTRAEVRKPGAMQANYVAAPQPPVNKRQRL